MFILPYRCRAAAVVQAPCLPVLARSAPKTCDEHDKFEHEKQGKTRGASGSSRHLFLNLCPRQISSSVKELASAGRISVGGHGFQELPRQNCAAFGIALSELLFDPRFAEDFSGQQKPRRYAGNSKWWMIDVFDSAITFPARQVDLSQFIHTNKAHRMVNGPGQHQMEQQASHQSPPQSLAAPAAGFRVNAVRIVPPRPQERRFCRVCPGLEEIIQWISDEKGRREAIKPASASSSEHGYGLECVQSLSKKDAPTTSGHVPSHALHAKNVLEALLNATAIRNAVRLQPLGYRPGVTGGRVGLLGGLRTADMDKYDEVRPWWSFASSAHIISPTLSKLHTNTQRWSSPRSDVLRLPTCRASPPNKS